MGRKTLTLVGLLELLVPQRVLAVVERLAFADRGDAERRSWVVPAARLEGLCWLLLARRTSTPTRRSLLGVVGLPALIAPKRTLDVWLGIAYTDADSIEMAPWIVPATRAVGLVSVLVGVRAWRARGGSSSGRKTSTESEETEETEEAAS